MTHQANESSVVGLPVNEAESLELHSDHNGGSAAAGSVEAEKATFGAKLAHFLHTYDFPICVLIAIGLAKAYPPLGADYLAPEITAKWIAVCIIFFFSGFGLRTGDFFKVIVEHLPFNIFLQVFNFLAVSAVVFGVTHLHSLTGILDEALISGLVICSCLPMSINVGIVLTTAAGGDVAAAVIHSVVGNALGIFISPLLILMYLPGVVANVDLAELIVSLIIRVLVPLVVGQLVQKLVPAAYDFYVKHKSTMKKIPELLLVYIVYTIFCASFAKEGEKAGWQSILVLMVSELLFQFVMSVVAWYCLRFLIPNEPRLRIAGTICSSHKTIALGAPLIGSIVQGQNFANEAFYFLPLLMWHPTQLVFGSMFTTIAHRWIASEDKRLEGDSSSEYATGIGTEEPVGNLDLEQDIGDEASEEHPKTN